MATTTVTDFTGLRTALQDPAIDYIYLGADISYTAYNGISVDKTRDVVIDGLDPITGEPHTLTDNDSSGSLYLIYVAVSPAVAVKVTFRNITFNGRNFYGVCHFLEGTGNANGELVLENINYVGPQAVHHRSGATRVINSTFDICANGVACGVNEFCETNRLFFEGNVKIIQASTTNSLLWLSLASPQFVVAPNSNIDVQPAYDLFYPDGGTYSFDLGENATMIARTNFGFTRTNGTSTFACSNFAIRRNAKLTVTQSSRLGSVATIGYTLSFLMEEGSSLDVRVSASGTSAILRTAPVNTSTVFTNPKSVILYNNNAPVFSFNSGSSVNVRAELLNIWTAPNTTAPGTLDDNPLYAWSKASGEDVIATATCAATSMVSASGNTTADDPGGVINTTKFNLITARVLSMGRLAFEVNDITDISTSINGTTDPDANVRAIHALLTANSVADGEGDYVLPLSQRLPKDSEVVVKTNIPFLIKEKRIIVLGSVSLSYTPERLPFYTVVVPSNIGYVKRADPDWHLEVIDTRDEGGDWVIYAQVTGPMTSDTSDLGNALGYKAGEEFTPFGSVGVPVFQGEFSPGTTSVEWTALEGALLKLIPLHLYDRGYYTTTVNWCVIPV